MAGHSEFRIEVADRILLVDSWPACSLLVLIACILLVGHEPISGAPLLDGVALAAAGV